MANHSSTQEKKILTDFPIMDFHTYSGGNFNSNIAMYEFSSLVDIALQNKQMQKIY